MNASRRWGRRRGISASGVGRRLLREFPRLPPAPYAKGKGFISTPQSPWAIIIKVCGQPS
jgi:hypothetical protein